MKPLVLVFIGWHATGVFSSRDFGRGYFSLIWLLRIWVFTILLFTKNNSFIYGISYLNSSRNFISKPLKICFLLKLFLFCSKQGKHTPTSSFSWRTLCDLNISGDNTLSLNIHEI